MVALVRPYGNHSNRLFQNLHIEAFCIENNIPFFNATMYDMAKLFAFHYKYFSAISIIILFRITNIFRLVNIQLVPYLDFTDTRQLERYKEHLLLGRDRLVFVGGWDFRAHQLVSKHLAFLRAKYSINKTNNGYLDICEKINHYEIVLGVHIRRNDYKSWQGGKYAFDDAAFNLFVDNFIKLQSGKKIFVLYFSDSKLNNSKLHKTSDHFVSNNKYYIDYKLMGKCNYLIGPPSTFTAWASFLYGVPCLHLENAMQEIHLEDFKIFNEG